MEILEEILDFESSFVQGTLENPEFAEKMKPIMSKWGEKLSKFQIKIKNFEQFWILRVDLDRVPLKTPSLPKKRSKSDTYFTSLYWGTITTKKSAGKNAGKSAGKSAGEKVLVKVIYDLRFLRILLHCIEVLLLLCTITTIVRAVVL